jgi:hypothetical protein
MHDNNSLAPSAGDAVDVGDQAAGFTVAAEGLDACGESIREEELQLIEDFLPDLLHEMLRHSDTLAEGERQ